MWRGMEVLLEVTYQEPKLSELLASVLFRGLAHVRAHPIQQDLLSSILRDPTSKSINTIPHRTLRNGPFLPQSNSLLVKLANNP
jgi:hypothetical protein